MAQQQGAAVRALMLSDIGYNPYASCLLCTEDYLGANADIVNRMTAASQQSRLWLPQHWPMWAALAFLWLADKLAVARVHLEIVHRHGGHSVHERLPGHAAVERDIHADIRPDVEQVAIHRILGDHDGGH